MCLCVCASVLHVYTSVCCDPRTAHTHTHRNTHLSAETLSPWSCWEAEIASLRLKSISFHPPSLLPSSCPLNSWALSLSPSCCVSQSLPPQISFTLPENLHHLTQSEHHSSVWVSLPLLSLFLCHAIHAYVATELCYLMWSSPRHWVLGKHTMTVGGSCEDVFSGGSAHTSLFSTAKNTAGGSHGESVAA